VTIVPADMRAWQAPSPADILVSELLVSALQTAQERSGGGARQYGNEHAPFQPRDLHTPVE
jgi:hypothetical protein